MRRVASGRSPCSPSLSFPIRKRRRQLEIDVLLLYLFLEATPIPQLFLLSCPPSFTPAPQTAGFLLALLPVAHLVLGGGRGLAEVRVSGSEWRWLSGDLLEEEWRRDLGIIRMGGRGCGGGEAGQQRENG